MIQTRIGMVAKVGGLWPITVVFLRDVFWTRVLVGFNLVP
jgi:hypothetical protein